MPGIKPAAGMTRIKNAATRFPFCAVPERLSASRPRLFGAAEFRFRAAGGGRFLLRIEDIDTTRCKPEFEAAIYQDLAWLGIAWEQPVRRQSEHLAFYREAVERLSAEGLVYPSFESRAEIAKLVARREADGRVAARSRWRAALSGRREIAVAGRARKRLLESGEPYALRLDMAAACARAGELSWIEHGAGPDGETGEIAAPPQAWGDVILARKETPTSYHLSVVVDDALQGVTEVVRGEDLFWSTSVHRLLQALLGLPAAGLSASPAGPRCRRGKALEIDRRHRLARTPRRRR